MDDDAKIDLLFGKIDHITSELHSIKIEMAKHNEAEKNRQQNSNRFWEQTWPDVLKQINQNRNEIAQLNVRIAELSTKMMIFGTSIVVSVPIISAIVFKYLGN